jgi:hypothetical protein
MRLAPERCRAALAGYMLTKDVRKRVLETPGVRKPAGDSKESNSAAIPRVHFFVLGGTVSGMKPAGKE